MPPGIIASWIRMVTGGGKNVTCFAFSVGLDLGPRERENSRRTPRVWSLRNWMHDGATN